MFVHTWQKVSYLDISDILCLTWSKLVILGQTWPYLPYHNWPCWTVIDHSVPYLAILDYNYYSSSSPRNITVCYINKNDWYMMMILRNIFCIFIEPYDSLDLTSLFLNWNSLTFVTRVFVITVLIERFVKFVTNLLFRRYSNYRCNRNITITS
jgi:hypothetical protein